MSDRHTADFRQRLYPAFSRRATQVCILSAALEKIEGGAEDAPAIARTALEDANPFGWKQRQPAKGCSACHGGYILGQPCGFCTDGVIASREGKPE